MARPLDHISCVVLTRIKTLGYDRGRPDPLPPQVWSQLPYRERRKVPRLFPVYTSWSKALKQRFRTDAHAAMYLCRFPGWEKMHPRLNTGAADMMAELGFEVMAQVAMVDVDLPEHLSWGISEEADRITRQNLEFLHEEMGAYIYATLHGARALWPLPRPMRVKEFERFLLMFLTYLQGRIPRVDMKCRDWTRLFRLPRVRRELEGQWVHIEPSFEWPDHRELSWMPKEPEPEFDARHWHLKPWDPNPINDQEANVYGALEYLDASNAEVWMRVGMCIHTWTPVRGLAIWDRWSKRSPRYHRSEILRTWRSFKEDGYPPQLEPAGLHVLFELASGRGWDPCAPGTPPHREAVAVAGIPGNGPPPSRASKASVLPSAPPAQQMERGAALQVWAERVQEMYDLGALSTERYLYAIRHLTRLQTGWDLEL